MAWLVTRSTEENDANNATLLFWNIATNKIDETRRIAGAWPVGLTTLDRVPLLATPATRSCSIPACRRNGAALPCTSAANRRLHRR
jgi:hypothetical protein